MSRAPLHPGKIYENASVSFCPKISRTNICCLTPLPTKCPVDDKRGESEYVDGPLGKRVYEVRRTENCSYRLDFRSYFEATSPN